MPPLTAPEALETSMIHSLAGLLDEGGISRTRPFRARTTTASMAAIVGGGRGAKPGEVSLAHNGVLFLDEFPEYTRAVLETLRQPIETGEVIVARANAHVRYPLPIPADRRGQPLPLRATFTTPTRPAAARRSAARNTSPASRVR